MALWQFKIWFVPAEFIGGRVRLDEHECEEMLWGNTKQPPENFREVFSNIIPPLESWSEDLLQWGTQDGDLIEVWLEENQVESISARIDCRNLNPEFVRQIVEIAQRWKYRLVYQRHRTLLPDDFNELVGAIRESPNLKFMENPRKWLPKLASEVADQGEPEKQD